MKDSRGAPERYRVVFAGAGVSQPLTSDLPTTSILEGTPSTVRSTSIIESIPLFVSEPANQAPFTPMSREPL